MPRTMFSPRAAAALLLCAVAGSGVSACAADAAPEPGTPGSGFDKSPDSPAPPTPTAPPTPNAPTIPAGLACLGAQAPLTLVGGMPYAKVHIGKDPSFEASYLLDLATTGSTIDLTKFPAPGPTATQCDPSKLGQICSFAELDFFGPWGEVTLRTAKHGGPQSGILGTDFMSLVAITLDYGAAVVRQGTEKDFCSKADLEAAGFTALSAAGFFAKDVKKLKPLSEVVAGAGANVTVSNLPTVPLRIAGVTTLAQLDTGFDDAVVPYSINVNEAFLADVTSKNPSALVRAVDKDLFLSTCAGVSEPVEAYTLAPGTTVDFMSELGPVAKSFPAAVLFVKHTPPAAMKCGGIGTWTVPAAQVAASFYVALGVMVFDPFGSRVWVK